MSTSAEEGQPGEDRVVVHLPYIIYHIRSHCGSIHRASGRLLG